MSDRIAIVGRQDAFQGFRALGVDVREPGEAGDSVEQLLRSLDPREYGIVFVSDELAAGIQEIIDERTRRTTQAVIVIPSGKAAAGRAGERIRRLVRRAVGADIL